MVVGRGGVLLAGEELLEGLLLLSRACENQGELIEWEVRGNHADVIGGSGPKGMVIRQRLQLGGVDGLRDAIRRLELGRRAGEGSGRQQNRCKGKPYFSENSEGTMAYGKRRKIAHNQAHRSSFYFITRIDGYFRPLSIL